VDKSKFNAKRSTVKPQQLAEQATYRRLIGRGLCAYRQVVVNWAIARLL
jgi:hypothetical protein